MSEPASDYGVDIGIAAVQAGYIELIPAILPDLVTINGAAYADQSTADAAASAIAASPGTVDVADRLHDLYVWRATVDLQLATVARAVEIIGRYLTGLEVTS